jgi:A/G-specific adenine glycosylase
MLQQTQVETVIPYYHRFMRRFPTVAKLARARPDTVLKFWEGLGYYSRARNLHRAARDIVSRYDGALPNTKDELLTLPGIGAYTAGAITSIAFGQREQVVDGNVTRLLCRLFRIRENPRQARAQRRVWALAEELLPRTRCGDFNQAMMELGSEICLSRNPQCDRCPLAEICEARRHNEQNVLPIRAARKKIPTYTIAVAVVYRDGRILIDKRKPDGLLGGLWEFPGGKKKPRESLKAAAKREVREELGTEIQVRQPLAVVDHAYSHFRIRMHAFECAYVSGEPQCVTCTAFKWVRPNDLDRYPFPAANKKIIRILRSNAKSAVLAGS